MPCSSKVVAAALVALAALAGSPATLAQNRIHCESRNYTYQFCPVGGGVDAAFLLEQRSRSACVQGQSWGWDRRGVWVDRGCDAVFDVRTPPPVVTPRRDGGLVVNCASRDYQQEFCPLPAGADQVVLVNQRSQAPCIEGRSWGWRANGLWVNAGCEGDFEVRTSLGAAPAAPPPARGLLYCESSDYRYTFCPTGRLRAAQLVNERSQSACVYGQSWGYQDDGVWVDRGCAAEFSIQTR